MNCLFVFPGQGSQYLGIGSDLHERYAVAREVYQNANDVLGYDVAKLSFEGPEEQINQTRYTQPVLLTHHLACLRVFEELTEGAIKPTLCAGHSLGEYSALVAAGRLGVSDALTLVRYRGELMGEHGEGEMLALPLPLDDARGLAEQHYCAVAGCNLADQTVVGGAGPDLDRLEQHFSEQYPKKRAVRLKTEGAFHTYYMVGAATRFREHLDRAQFLPGDTGVACNYTGGMHDADPDSVRARLFLQLFFPVLWLDNFNAARAAGADTVIEFGGGLGSGGPAERRPNLAGMIKKAQRGKDNPAAYHAAINCDTLEAAAAALA